MADDGQQQQQGGGMHDEMAVEGDEPDGLQEVVGDDGGWMDMDDDDDSDADSVDYEEEGVAIPTGAANSVAVPDGCLAADEIEAVFPVGTSDATKDLAVGIIGRTSTSPQQVTGLIERDADVNVIPRLRKKGSKCPGTAHPLLALSIDDKSGYTIRTIRAGHDDGGPSGQILLERPVALPQWSSDQLQEDIMTALLDGGADIDAAVDDDDSMPLYVAVASGNEKAFDVLMVQDGIDLAETSDGRVQWVMVLPCALRQPPDDYLRALLSMYQRLIQRDPTLAIVQDDNGTNLVHMAAMRAGEHHPQSFIDGYLNFIAEHGADIAAEDITGRTPLHWAAESGHPYLACYLCRKLPTADDINKRNILGTDTPLATAAGDLSHLTEQIQDPDTSEQTKDRYRGCKLTIRTLLRAGADISSIPTDTQEGRRERRLVLTEYAAVLNELPIAVMAAVNAAIAPHRSFAALLTPRLSVGPQEAPVFGWRIASYLFDMAAAKEAITEAMGMRHSVLARRVFAAAEHFVRSAVCKASSNREVVGGTADVGGQVVRVPLQCFVLEGADGRLAHAVHTAGRVGLREVVHRAVLDEVAKWGVPGVVKGFNAHLGDADCQFTWQQLGAALQQPTTPPPPPPPPATPAPASTQEPTPSTQQPTPPPPPAAASGCDDAVDDDSDSWEEVSEDDEMDDEVEE
ncbi:unnamed protein product [Vitrella brassicaformis CCMP3155]|uniref:Uncharacterized protein n=1 Tax=Vitrella brassicaformis (strain CCMP3155) TaxID=1169540 RepID=A0A0G4EQB9_VITBC|nr:unnamed protein product [Vitrella brassicaformis CCMP3155]|eukprot:CEL99656.1 unnamed protein product [Vitrella brassicaformis CCMP3155]